MQHRKISVIITLQNSVKPDNLNFLDAFRPCARLFVPSSVMKVRFASLDELYTPCEA